MTWEQIGESLAKSRDDIVAQLVVELEKNLGRDWADKNYQPLLKEIADMWPETCRDE